MKEKHASMTNQYMTKKTGGYGLHRYPRKEEDFLPEEKRVA